MTGNNNPNSNRNNGSSPFDNKKKKKRTKNRGGNGNHTPRRVMFKEIFENANWQPPVVPGPDKAEQFEKTMDGCKQYVSAQAHLAPALKALNMMERQVESDFLPTKPDPSSYAKQVEVQALDEKGHPLTDPEDNMIIVKQWVVHSPQDEKQAWNDYVYNALVTELVTR